MWLIILLGIIAFVGLVILGLSGYLFYFIFHKPKRSTKIPKFYIDTPHYKVSREGMKLLKTLPCKDVFITSRDGLRLHAYYFPAPVKSNKYLLGIHGYRSYSRPEFAPYAEFYRSLGYNLLLPDDRAHRPSEGTYIGFGVLDRLDCVDWAKYLSERFGQDAQILLHGVSMGAATVLAASGEQDLPRQVKGVIGDCGYSRAWEVLAHQLQSSVHLPVKPFLPICEKLCKWKAGFDFHEFAPVVQVRSATVPMLIVHGGKDPMVPPEMAQEIFDASGSLNKRLLMVPEAGHGESIAFAPEEYHKAIIDLFES